MSRPLRPEEVESLLVYSGEEIIGDGLIKLPFVAAMRDAFPKARFAWCAASGRCVYAEALRPVTRGLIDDFVLDGVTGTRLSDFLLLRRPFHGRRFDLVLDTQSNVRRSLVARRGARRLFISPAAGFRLSSRRPSAPKPEGMLPRLQQLAELAAGGPVALRPVPLVDDRGRAVAAALLPPGPTYVGFAPGAGGPERRWPLERYIALARRQVERGRTPVFFVGPAERKFLGPVRAGCPEALIPQEDPRTASIDVSGVLLTIALATRLAAAVANDAGPAHMLAAGGAPLLSLFRFQRKAAKFVTASPRADRLIAEDYGGPEIERIPLEDVDERLERLLRSG